MRYARIENDTVMELFETNGDITQMFHPNLVWVPCPSPEITEGWRYVDGAFLLPLPDETPVESQMVNPTPRYIDANDVTIGQAERLYTAASSGEVASGVLLELLDL